MADSEGSDALKTLGNKVGPLPVWVWLAAFGAIWWYFSHHGSLNPFGSSSAPAAGTSQTGYGTDPAGNTGYIDPQTGYVYGSAEDIASLQQQGTVAGNTYAGSAGGSTGSTGGYADDSAWAQAAINYLVARGVDPTQANQAIQLYLSGQNLTSAQQADVNLAIQGIGAPPQLPGPSTGNPGTIQTPPGGSPAPSPSPSPKPSPSPAPKPKPVPKPKPKAKAKAKAPATPTGITASNVGPNGFTLHWHPVAGATSYRVRITYQGRLARQLTTRSTSAAVTGLTPDHTYTVHVAAVSGAGMSPEGGGPAVKTLR